jgi:hypothetical protein
MLSPGQWLACSAGVIGLLGALHLLYTFQGKKLRPRDTHLERQMELVSPEISRHTTMWRAWVGFNASHAFGALFFAAVYGYLALFEAPFLFRSPFLVGVGLLLLLGYAWLGVKYWFRIPLAGIVIALGLYLLATWQAWMR